MIGSFAIGPRESSLGSRDDCCYIVLLAAPVMVGVPALLSGISMNNSIAIGVGSTLIALPFVALATAICCHYTCKRCWASYNDYNELD